MSMTFINSLLIGVIIANLGLLYFFYQLYKDKDN
jgi:hypothetical protein